MISLGRILKLAAVALVLFLGLPVTAQVSEGWTEVVVVDRACPECSIVLARDWRYHPGDNPSWADPEFDDSDWALVLPSLRNAEAIPGGWPGIGWFRRKIRTSEEFGNTLGIHVAQAGASEIYLDGRRVAQLGTVSTDPEEEKPSLPQYVSTITLEPEVDHLLAVRYSNVTGNIFQRDFQGFEITAGAMQDLSASRLKLVRQYTTFMATALGVFGAFTLLHLLLFAFQPKATENLFLAILTGSMVGMLLAELQMGSISDLAKVLVYYKWFLTGVVAMGMSALLVEHRVFKQRLSPTFYVLAAAAIGILFWIWSRPALGGNVPTAIFIAAVYLVTLWWAILALVDRQPDAWVIGLGFLVVTLCVFAILFRMAGWIEIPHALTATLGVGSLALSFSVYLTRRIASTNRELEARLQEIDDLTAKTIEQERQVAREEVDRRLLEADNQRKTTELERARQLQLAMLPKQVPELEGFRIAVHMSTANEVGGDYYDFHTNGSGSCTLVMGDATGHGLHAGMVVGVAKSLFQTCGRESNLAGALGRIGEGLSSMHRRQASMAMLLARLDGHNVRLASAGMPPVLVWRQVDGSVEEVMLPSVPLATLADVRFNETEIDLQGGDSVLLMTDGLAEVANSDGDLLGYERASRFFAEVAELEPELAIERLLERAAAYNEGTPLQDDMTLMVLKARS
jgi:serine phosphatase RsbU (regulator of sigma subunit)